jgi:hypothetical protein
VTNREEIFRLIQKHPEGLDDDDISEMTGIQPRQQVQQLCTQLAAMKRIRRESVDKAGKRRKIHNFPIDSPNESLTGLPHADSGSESWRRRLSALVAATGRSESDLLEESLHLLAMKVLEGHGNGSGKPSQRPKK